MIFKLIKPYKQNTHRTDKHPKYLKHCISSFSKQFLRTFIFKLKEPKQITKGKLYNPWLLLCYDESKTTANTPKRDIQREITISTKAMSIKMRTLVSYSLILAEN